LIEIKGKNNKVLNRTFYEWSGSWPGQWNWTELGFVDVALDTIRMEVALDWEDIGIDPDSQSFEVYFYTTDWEEREIDYSDREIYIGEGEGTRAAMLQEMLNGVGSVRNDKFGWNVSYAGDVNNDGYPDIIVGAPYSNGYGYNDIVTGNIIADTITILNGTSSNIWEEEGTLGPVDYPRSIYVGDANNDGYNDIVTADDNDNALSVYNGTANGDWDPRCALSTGTDPYSIFIGDANNDGLNDILTADYGSDVVSIFNGTSNGLWEARGTLSVGDQPYCVFVSDANNDGLNDVITADYNDDTVSIYNGTSSGSWETKYTLSVGWMPYSVYVGDANNDGYNDILTVDYGDDTISIYNGTSTGFWEAKGTLGVGDTPICVFIGDANNDGLNDIVNTDYNDKKIGVYKGKSDGTWESRITMSTGNFPRSVFVGDANNDGYNDLLTSDFGDYEVTIYNGTSSGGWESRGELDVGDGPFAVFVADANNDGSGPNAGAAYIFFGFPGIDSKDIHPANANVTIYGENAGDLLGWSVSDLGNVDSDTKDDVIIGAPGYNSSYTYMWGSSDVKVNQYVDSTKQMYPGVVVDSEGNLIVVWCDERNGDTDDDIYAQKFDSEGNSLWGSSDVKVNQNSDSVIQTYPTIAVDSDGNVIIVWEDNRNGASNYTIYAQKLNSSGVVQWGSSDLRINQNISSVNRLYPNVAIDTSDDAIIVWTDYRNGPSDPDIYAQKLNSAGEAQWGSDDVKVNQDSGTDNQDWPDIDIDSNGNAFVVWEDDRNGATNYSIYAQMLNSTGDAQWGSSDKRVNRDTDSYDREVPVVALASNDKIYVGWNDERNGVSNKDIYAQLLDSSGDPQWSASDVEVHQNSDTDSQTMVDLAVDSDGNAIFVWRDARPDLNDDDIYAQKFNLSGVAQWGVNDTKVNQDSTFANQMNPAVAIDPGDNIIVVWQDGRPGSTQEDIYAQKLGNSATGRAYVFYGRSSWNPSYDASSADVTISGVYNGERFGMSVSGAGDVDGSNYNDILVGAPGYNGDQGRAYIFYGDGSIPTSSVNADKTMTGEYADDKFGFSVSNAGDINNDGKDDVIIGAPYNDDSGIDAGKAYVYHFSDVYSYVTSNTTIYGIITDFNNAKSASDSGAYAILKEQDVSETIEIFNETFPWALIPWDGSLQDEAWTTANCTDVEVNSEKAGSPSGTPSAMFDDADNGFGTPETAELFYATIDLSAYDNVTIEYYWYTDDVDSGEGFRSAYSTDSTDGVGGTWNQMYEHLDPVDDAWTKDGPYSVPDNDCVSGFMIRFSASFDHISTENIWIDDVVISGNRTPYKMDLEFNATNVPSGDSYTLQLNYSVDGSETEFGVLVYNGTSDDWDDLGSQDNLSSTSFTTKNYTLNSDHVVGSGYVRTRFIGRNETDDNVNSTLNIEYMRIKTTSQSYSLTGESGGNLFGWSVANVSDISSDGSYDDIIVGAPGYFNVTGTPTAAWGSSDVWVNQDISANKEECDIAVDSQGNSIIVFGDYRNGDWDIYAQKIDPEGNVLWGPNDVKVNQNTDSDFQRYPEVAIDSNDNAIFIWQDYRSNNWDIYAQKLNSSGEAQWGASDVSVGDNPNDVQRSPDLAVDTSGNTFVVWEDERDGISDENVYAQKLNSAGNVQWGSDVKVNEDNDDETQTTPSVDCDSNGNAIIVWSDRKSGTDPDIYAQKLDTDGAKQWSSSDVQVNQNTTGNQGSPRVVIDSSNYAIAVWSDTRTGSIDVIAAQKLDTSGAVQWGSSDIMVNQTTISASRISPDLAIDSGDNVVIVWKDERNGASDDDVYVQKMNSSGIALWGSSDVKVNQNSDSDVQEFPKVAVDPFGNTIVAWEDQRGSYADIYAQKLEASIPGRAYIYHGGSPMDTTADASFEGDSGDDKFGYSVHCAGDIDSDGNVDAIVGAPYYDDGSKSDCGSIYVLKGGPSMYNATRYIFKGSQAGEHIGWSVSFALNINGSTKNAVVTGSPYYNDGPDSDTGKAYLLYLDEILELVINEIQFNPTGSDDNVEWVELYNPGGSAIDLTGWYLIDNDGWKFDISGAGSISSGGYLVCHLADAGTNTSTNVYGSIVYESEVVVQPSISTGKDVYLDSTMGILNTGSWTWMTVMNASSVYKRPLIQFDLSSLPSGNVSGAKVWLYRGTGDESTGATVIVHRVTQSWTEGDGSANSGANWGTYDGTNTWATNGGDYDSTDIDIETVLAGTNGWYSWSVTDMVEGWKNGTYSNYGMIFNATSGSEAHNFYTSDYTTDTSLIPKLVVNLTTSTMLEDTDDLTLINDNDIIIDYVAWGGDAELDDDNAVAWGHWTDGDYADTSEFSENETLGRDKDSTDTDSYTDWENSTTNKADPYGVNASSPTQGSQNIDFVIPEFEFTLIPIMMVPVIFLTLKKHHRRKSSSTKRHSKTGNN
jgi:hypothetical protein